MGIDIYMEWNGMTEMEKKARMTGFSIYAGDVGYLREAYHGEPYATRALVPEAFAAEGKAVEIQAATLRSRLPEVLVLVRERSRKIYHERAAKAVKAFVDFVELAERKEKETGHPVLIEASY